LRNDVSRIAAVGSVRVPALCVPERYETVWQLTSDVTGTLRTGVGLVDIFRALFPCGSGTGAPKPRTMQIIREVEDESRGVYCGAIGLLAPPGAPLRARFNVAIRTMVLDRARGHAVYGTGGGITWGSDPDAELAELHTKAEILRTPYQDFQLVETMAHIPGRGVRHLDPIRRSSEPPTPRRLYDRLYVRGTPASSSAEPRAHRHPRRARSGRARRNHTGRRRLPRRAADRRGRLAPTDLDPALTSASGGEASAPRRTEVWLLLSGVAAAVSSAPIHRC